MFLGNKGTGYAIASCRVSAGCHPARPPRRLGTVGRALPGRRRDPAAAARRGALTRTFLDSTIVSDLPRNPQGRVPAHAVRVGEGAPALNIVTAAELRFGAARSASPAFGRMSNPSSAAFPCSPSTVPPTAPMATSAPH